MAQTTTDLFDMIDWDLVDGTKDSNQDDVRPTGTKLEVKTYDVRDNSKGDKVTLNTGKKSDFPKKYNKDHESALVVTKTYDNNGKVERMEIVVRSPHIRTALREVVGRYPGLNLDSENATLSGPPQCLFHYHKELVDYGRRLRDQTAREHVLFALNYMKTTFTSDIPHYLHCMANRNPGPGLDFDRLWMAYRPGDLIFVKSHGETSVGRLVEISEQGFFYRRWQLKLERIVCTDGELAYSTFSASIDSYSGFKHLQHLDVFPFKYHPNPGSVRPAIINRGIAFLDLLGVHQRFYRGNARWAADPPPGKEDWYAEGYYPFIKFQVKSRVMIDSTAFGEARPDHETHATYFESKTGTKPPDEKCEENYLICHNEVFGYSLTDKRWCAFDIDHLEKIDFSTAAFDRLLLPPDQKKTILSLVAVHTDESLKFDDVVNDKGKGMIFLLHGVPGVGKTLTAESIADYVKRPLFPLRSGDMGIDAKSVEKSLGEAFEMAAKWNAIILLDEADVFLEARRVNDLQRNSLVSVFLRVLEYYEGIMFLTTNRIEVFDPAFKSRIHLSMKYHPLCRDFRLQLWRDFIKSGAPENWDQSVLEDDFLDGLADHDINGRQIRNMVRTAYALAVSAGERLKTTHLQTALRAMIAFEEGGDDADKTLVNEDAMTTDSRSRKRRRQ